MATINELRDKFDGMSVSQKKQFIINMKQQLEGSSSASHKQFLNECIKKYKIETDSGQSKQDASSQGYKDIITRSNANKKAIVYQVILMIVCSIAIILCYYHFINNTILMRYDRSSIIILYCLVVCAVGFCVYTPIVNSKSFICVTQQGIYGVAHTTMSTKPFEFTFQQITDVRKTGNMFFTAANIVIECGPHICKCSVDNPEKIVSLIKSMKSKYT